jgi:hypothetical protein
MVASMASILGSLHCRSETLTDTHLLPQSQCQPARHLSRQRCRNIAISIDKLGMELAVAPGPARQLRCRLRGRGSPVSRLYRAFDRMRRGAPGGSYWCAVLAPALEP